MFSLFRRKQQEEREMKEIDQVLQKIHIKCAYGENLAILNEAERTLYLNDIFQKEIENGGFAMLFQHSAGVHTKDMVRSLKQIGASRSAQLLMEAEDKFAQNESMSDAMFFELNEALQAMGEDLTIYQTAYMLKHKNEITK